MAERRDLLTAALFLALGSMVPGCAHLRAVNSREATLQTKMQQVAPGTTLKMVLSDGSVFTGILDIVEWPQVVLWSGDSRFVVDATEATEVWERYLSKRKGQAIGALLLVVPFAIAGKNAAKYPLICLGPCEPTDQPLDLVVGAVFGGAFGAGFGAALGAAGSRGSPQWRQLFSADDRTLQRTARRSTAR